MKVDVYTPPPVARTIKLELTEAEAFRLHSILGKLYGSSYFVTSLHKELGNLELKNDGFKAYYATDNRLYVKEPDEW